MNHLRSFCSLALVSAGMFWFCSCGGKSAGETPGSALSVPKLAPSESPGEEGEEEEEVPPPSTDPVVAQPPPADPVVAQPAPADPAPAEPVVAQPAPAANTSSQLFLASSQGPPGAWYQNDGTKGCSNVCQSAGKSNVQSNDGYKCTSGENIAPSAVGKIQFNACWPDRNNCGYSNYYANARDEHVNVNRGTLFGRVHIQGQFCYGDGQDKDHDPSDRVSGCFCK